MRQCEYCGEEAMADSGSCRLCDVEAEPATRSICLWCWRLKECEPNRSGVPTCRECRIKTDKGDEMVGNRTKPKAEEKPRAKSRKDKTLEYLLGLRHDDEERVYEVRRPIGCGSRQGYPGAIIELVHGTYEQACRWAVEQLTFMSAFNHGTVKAARPKRIRKLG